MNTKIKQEEMGTYKEFKTRISSFSPLLHSNRTNYAQRLKEGDSTGPLIRKRQNNNAYQRQNSILSSIGSVSLPERDQHKKNNIHWKNPRSKNKFKKFLRLFAIEHIIR